MGSPLVTNTVLVPFDYSAASRKALRVARSLVDDVGQIRVLNVVQPLVAPPTIMIPTFDTGEIVASSEKALAEVLQENELDGAQASIEVGAPGPTIVESAKRDDVDLIVMPTHGRTGLERVFVGSVAEYVVRHAHCPVLALRGGSE
jgi:nucleotide-binding universal stress UspA family protein